MQIPQLTFLRFVAALGVVLFHFGQQTWPWNTPVLLPLVQQAGLGVGFFFTLSGFLMAWVYAPQPRIQLRTYAQARVARILPLYLLTFVLALAAELLIRGTRPRGLPIILQALGLQAWVPGCSLLLNFPGWSVSVELFFYAAFPLLLLLMRGRPAWMLVTGTALLAGISLWVFLNIGTWTQGFIQDPLADLSLRFPPLHLHAFVTGMAGGLLYQSGRLRLPNGWLPGLLFLLLAAAMLSLAWVENPILGRAGDGLLAPVYLALILCLAQDQGLLSRMFSRRLPVFLGEMSYAVYLLQAPVYIALEPLAKASGAPGLHAGWLWVYLAVLLLLSACTYRYFERPLRQWLRPRTA